LGEFMAQVRHSDVGAMLFEKRIDAILRASATLGAFQLDHIELRRSVA
jgi:hypothetical protein